MKNYYIFRHGETFVTEARYIRWYGLKNRTVSILPKGIPTIKRLGEYVKHINADAYFRSEYLRCTETAQIVTDITDKTFVPDKRLNEYSFETFWHFRKRIKNFIDDLEKSSYKTIVVCTHGAGIAGLSNLLTTGEFTFNQLFRQPRPGVLMIIKNGKQETIDFNTKIT